MNMNEPKLRFKADDGSQFPDWEEKRLEEIVGKISSGKDKACNGNYVLYGSTGIIGTCQSPTYKGRKILVARVGANAGTVNLVNDDCGVSDNTLIINNMDLCNFDWLYFYMVHKELGKMRFGSGQPLITGTMLRDLCIQLPNDFEQQKIAEFLSTIDTVIEKQKETVSAWEERKKGVMQKLFSQEVRFKADDGSDFPEWEEKKLGECCDILDSKRKPISKENRVLGKYAYYGSTNIQDYINEYLFDEPLVLLAEDAGPFDDFWNKAIAQFATGKFWVNNHAHVLRPHENRKYFFYSLEHRDIRVYINNPSRGKLNQEDMVKIPMYIPCLAEQQKIADCLSSLDDVIEKQKATLAAWEELKKGLLQQMFV